MWQTLTRMYSVAGATLQLRLCRRSKAVRVSTLSMVADAGPSSRDALGNVLTRWTLSRLPEVMRGIACSLSDLRGPSCTFW